MNRFYLLIAITISAVLVFAQSRPYGVKDAVIGPDSVIEMAAGSSYTAQVMYPVPDGPLYPLKASVSWSVKPPVEGISIDKISGQITVAATVAHGAKTTVYADVENGQRILEAPLLVFTREANPLVGKWQFKQKLYCASDQPAEPPGAPVPPSGGDLRFHVDSQFWIGRPFGIAAGVKSSGKYDYDVKEHSLVFHPTFPPNKPDSTWHFNVDDAGTTLTLQSGENSMTCGYVFTLETPAPAPPK